MFSNARIKIFLLASLCMMMGWMLTTTLGPAEDNVASVDVSSYDLASGGVMAAPAGYGGRPDRHQMQPGILGENEPEDEFGRVMAHGKEPSVTGALTELHHAVKGKLQLWNPYYSKPPPVPDNAFNATASDMVDSVNITASSGEAITNGISEDAMLGARTRIGKCTILFNGNSYWERAIRTHERHDREHGYRLHVLRQHLMDDVWSKPAYILSLLLRELSKPESERLEWLFWVDADTIILNPYIPIDVFLPPQGTQFDDVHLMYSNDWNGLNNGVFPIRVNQWSVKLFSAITSFRHYRPKADLVFRDQSAMDMLMNEPEFVDNIVQAPQRWFNAYQGEHNETLAPFQIRRGDFLVHFAGVGNREERMGYWLERAEQHLDDWEVPVKSTSYIQEVKDFWAEQANARRDRKQLVVEQKTTSREKLDKISKEMEDYGDRLGEELRVKVTEKQDELRSKLDDEKMSNNIELLKESEKKLEEVAEPLKTAIDEAQKVMLTSAHKAIFGGEKDLLEAGFNDGESTPELIKISESVNVLKSLVMMPQEHWNRQQMAGATNDVTLARASYRGTITTVGGGKENIASANEGVLAANATVVAPQASTGNADIFDASDAIDASDALDAEVVQPAAEQSETDAPSSETTAPV
jgi:hypothetical protein